MTIPPLSAPESGPPLTSMPPTAAETQRMVPATAFADRRCTYGSCVHKDGVYRMIGSCLNCQTEPILGLFTAGHEAIGGDCPVCGCARLTWKRLATPDEIPAGFERTPG